MPSAWVFGEVEVRPAERRVLRARVPQALGGRAAIDGGHAAAAPPSG